MGKATEIIAWGKTKRAFDARVEPIWFRLLKTKKSCSPADFAEKKKAIDRTIALANASIRGQGAEPGNWDTVEGECVANIRIDRLAALHDLRVQAAKIEGSSPQAVAEGKAGSRFAHLIKGRDRFSYYLPVDFPAPFEIELKEGGGGKVPIGSSVRLSAELAELNRALKAEGTFKIANMVDFLEASAEDMAKYEAHFNIGGAFWAKFGFVILSKLARKSIEHNMPIIVV
jgi:hypothetical protein